MKVSQKGHQALKAKKMLARLYSEGAVKSREFAEDEEFPGEILELVLLELMHGGNDVNVGTSWSWLASEGIGSAQGRP
jgi:hypothetical protein